jgi:hypothetical protein
MCIFCYVSDYLVFDSHLGYKRSQVPKHLRTFYNFSYITYFQLS